MWWVIGTVVAVAALLVITFVFRLRRVSAAGSFEFAIRKGGRLHVVEGWARYAPGRFNWYALASLKFRPSRSWTREELADLQVSGTATSPRGRELVVVTIPGEEDQFLMWRPAYAGLRSWVEAAPPRATSPAS